MGTFGACLPSKANDFTQKSIEKNATRQKKLGTDRM